jgi:hypothetical protein
MRPSPKLGCGAKERKEISYEFLNVDIPGI